MEGPTPVSALLHAATMVTAGVFLILRCSILYQYSDTSSLMLILIGGLTVIFAGLTALMQYDVKKIIAYSTCSQLGYMFFTCGLNNYILAFSHLVNHAFFKALLFLSAGSVIHAMSDEQDLRRLNNLKHILPFTYICFLIGTLAIMGFPFLTGFYSKDLILEFSYSRYILDGLFIYSIGLFGAILTAIYSVRLLYLLFVGRSEPMHKSNSYISYIKFTETNVVEAPIHMLIAMSILAICSIFVGYFFSEIFAG